MISRDFIDKTYTLSEISYRFTKMNGTDFIREAGRITEI